jgi:DNA repair exonuclease SbcCD nuclease subunit
MKIVFATDFHLDACPGGYDLQADIERALETVEIECADASLLVIGGDVFNTKKPTPRAYATALKLLQSVACPVILVQGNHDIGTYGPLETVQTVGVVDEESAFDLDGGQVFVRERKVLVVTEVQVVGFGGVRLLVAPYMPQATSVESLDAVYERAFNRARDERVAAAFCHLDVRGAHGGKGEPQSIPNACSSLACPVLNGHIHGAQTVGNVVMPGSLVPVAFGEGGPRAIAILEV